MNNEKTKLERSSVYYVQTGEFKKYFNEINGRDDILFFDYMGSAEFEFGAPIASTKRMFINSGFYDFFTFNEYTDKDGKPLVVYAPVMFIEHIKANIDSLAKGKLRLIERSSTLYDHLSYPEADPRCPMSNFWWDIQNDFYIFFGEERKELISQAQEVLKKKYIEYKMIDINSESDSELATYYLDKNKDLSNEAIEFLNSKIESNVSMSLHPSDIIIK